MVVVLASVVVGLAAFVGACALVYSTGWLSIYKPPRGNVVGPSFFPPQWSPDSTKIVMDSWWGPYLVDASSGSAELRKIAVGPRPERFNPRISPDGSQIVFSTRLHRVEGVGSDIGVSNLDGSEYRRLTRSRGFHYGVEWSPDGSQIAFVSSQPDPDRSHDRSYGLYTMASNGSGPRKLVDAVRPKGYLSWAPGGEKIAFLGYGSAWPEGIHLFIVDRDGLNLIRLSEASSPPAWSPDGSTIAFIQGDDRDSLFAISPDGSGLRKIANLAYIQGWEWTPYPHLSWSPDGSEILLQDYPFVLVKADGSTYEEGEAPYVVFAGPEDWYIAHASWSPDGSRIAITVEELYGPAPNEGDAILLTMARDGSDMRVLARASNELGLHAVPNEPWEGEGGWVWYSP